ncbi:Membrane transport protein [Sesbania bispinosa]|nr:Membrane transport protein [Sesbania bispinosa]
MDMWELFLVALMPVLKLLLITAIGAILALDRFDILRGNVRKHLNIMVYFVFAPALICSNLARTITLRSLFMLWFLPLNVLIRNTAGIALGWLLVKIIRVPHHLHGLVLGCCAAANLGSLPLIIVPAICKERAKPFGDVDVCSRRGLAYASLSMALGHIYAWSIVYNIVRIYSPKTNVIKVDESIVNKEIDPENFSKCSTKSLVMAEDMSQPNNDGKDALEIECKVSDGKEMVVLLYVPEKPNIMKKLKILADKINLKALLHLQHWERVGPTLPYVTCNIEKGVPLFRKLLIGDNAHFHVVKDSVATLGEACIPAMILLIGSHLVKGIIKGAVHYNLIQPDPLYQFVLLLHYALPPAVLLSTMIQLLGVGESECSVIMVATYSCSAVFLTVCLRKVILVPKVNGSVTEMLGEGLASQTLTLVSGALYDQFMKKEIKDFDSFHTAILDIFK